MTMHENGTGDPAVLEDESHFGNPEWETGYSTPELHEDEWETHFSNPETHESQYSNPFSPETSTEDEQEGILGNILGALGLGEDYSSPEVHEDEWEVHEDEWETHYSNPEMHEWETHYSSPEVHERRDEPDQFLPFLAPLAMKALPLLGKALMPMAKKLIPQAGRAVSNVLRGVLGGRRRRRPMPGRAQPGGRAPTPARRPGGWAPRPRPARPASSWSAPSAPARTAPSGGWAPAPAGPSGGWAPAPARPTGAWGPAPVRPVGARRPGPAWRPGMRPRRRGASVPAARATVAGLFRQLSQIFGEGESEAAHFEAQLFGANEMEGELASHEVAHEAALTEVLAAEAAHTETESEAEALLGTALPITIRIMGGGRGLRRVTPTLVQANARLVRSIRNSGPAGPQLLRVVPAIQRRTVASLRAAQRAGRPLTPDLVSRVMAGQAARLLATPRIFGPAVVRNAAIRRATVARPGQIVRPRRPLPR